MSEPPSKKASEEAPAADRDELQFPSLGHPLRGLVAVITGGARGIGLGIAKSLAAQGAAIALIDLAPRTGARDSLPDAQGEIEEVQTRSGVPRKSFGVHSDVSDRRGLADAFQAILGHFGQVDIVVANAAASWRSGPLADMGEDRAWLEAKKTFEVCQFGAFHTCQIAAEYFKRRFEEEEEEEEDVSESEEVSEDQAEAAGRAQGRKTSGGKILLIGSIMSLFGSVGRMAYTMAKTSLNTLCTNLAREMAPFKVNVNIILPGYIDTPGEHLLASADQMQEAAEGIPWGRLGKPSDIGNAAAFLVSPHADYVTGSSLTVDGGYMVGLSLPFTARQEENDISSSKQ